MITYLLLDTFNGRVISRHRSIATACAAERVYAARVVRANGRGSYIPTTIRRDNPARATSTSEYEAALPLTEQDLPEHDRIVECSASSTPPRATRSRVSPRKRC